MAVAHLEVTRRSPFPFDYERIDGKLHFAVDPNHAANGRIVDLDKAPRDEAGRVRFWADFVLLQPADQGQANRRLLYFVVNRGLRVGVPFNRFNRRFYVHHLHTYVFDEVSQQSDDLQHPFLSLPWVVESFPVSHFSAK